MTVSKAEQKRIEKAAYRAKVVEALAKAHEAAQGAYNQFAATAKRSDDGHIADACGGAYVVVFKPSYAFRTTLQDLGEIESGYRGAWSISSFTRAVRDQSVTASEVAANAARDVLKAYFPEEQSIYTHSYLT